MISLALFKLITMSNKLIIMSKVRTIIRLFTEGVSKQSIGERTGLPRNSVKKYIRLFLASGKSMDAIEAMNDTELEQMFLDMVPRHHIVSLRRSTSFWAQASLLNLPGQKFVQLISGVIWDNFEGSF